MATAKTKTKTQAAPKAAAKPAANSGLKAPATIAAEKLETVPAKPVKSKKAVKALKAKKAEADKPKKPRLVRDSFTMPKAEYDSIDMLKRRSAVGGHAAKKSEILRAGLKVLADLTAPAFRAAMDAVPRIKTGRRPKDPK